MNSKVRHIIYGIISFVLSFVLFLLSFAIVLQSTILNPSYIMDNMNTSNYFVDKRDEIKESLVDLGYASGLDEKFFKNVVDEVTIHDNTQAYLNSFYAGEKAKIDTTAFKQKFNSELDSYISKNNLKVANDGSREYLINQAANIYAAALRIPLFATLSVYLVALKNMMPLIIGGPCRNYMRNHHLYKSLEAQSGKVYLLFNICGIPYSWYNSGGVAFNRLYEQD